MLRLASLPMRGLPQHAAVLPALAQPRTGHGRSSSSSSSSGSGSGSGRAMAGGVAARLQPRRHMGIVDTLSEWGQRLLQRRSGRRSPAAPADGSPAAAAAGGLQMDEVTGRRVKAEEQRQQAVARQQEAEAAERRLAALRLAAAQVVQRSTRLDHGPEAAGGHRLHWFFPASWKDEEYMLPNGRSWKVEELRLKSNLELHQLWYMLLIERNKWLTVYAEAERAQRDMRKDHLTQVQTSMDRLQMVVKERNEAHVAAIEEDPKLYTQRRMDAGLSPLPGMVPPPPQLPGMNPADAALGVLPSHLPLPGQLPRYLKKADRTQFRRALIRARRIRDAKAAEEFTQRLRTLTNEEFQRGPLQELFKYLLAGHSRKTIPLKQKCVFSEALRRGFDIA